MIAQLGVCAARKNYSRAFVVARFAVPSLGNHVWVSTFFQKDRSVTLVFEPGLSSRGELSITEVFTDFPTPGAGGALTFSIAEKVSKKSRLKKGDCALGHCIKF